MARRTKTSTFTWNNYWEAKDSWILAFTIYVDAILKVYIYYLAIYYILNEQVIFWIAFVR